MLRPNVRVLHDFFPGDLLAGVGGDATQDSRGRGLGYGPRLVKRPALVDIIERIDLLLNMTARPPGQIGRDRRFPRLWVVAPVRSALFVNEIVPGPVPAAVDLAAHRVDMHAVAVVVVHAEEVIHIAGAASCTTTEADRADRRSAAEPVRDVDVMDMLFDEMVARQRDPVLPRPHQVISRLRTNGSFPKHVADAERDAARVQSAECLLDGNGLVGFDEVPVVAHLRAGRDYEALLFGQLAGGNDAPAAGRVHGHGLFDEDVLAGLDGGFEVQWPKQRRRSHQDNLDIGLQQVLITGRTAEAALSWDIELLAGSKCPLLEIVGGGNDPNVEAKNLAGFENANGGAPTAATTADESHFEGLALSLGGCSKDGWRA